MLKVFFILITTAAFSVSGLAHAQPRTLRDLEESATRPTIADVIRVLGPHPKNNAYRGYLLNDQRFVSATKQLKLLARTIALMEFVYPHAIWAPLGRDAVIFGDALDAFYSANGEPHRVMRLNGSGSSIRGVDSKLLLKFMEDAGLDLDRLDRPFVGLDRTQFGSESQARYLLKAAFEGYVARGRDPRIFAKQVNFFGLAATARSHTTESLDEYFASLSSEYGVSSILQLEIGQWSDTYPWHDTFGALTVQPNGKFEGTPGDIVALQRRKIILGELIWLQQHVTTPDFFARVVAEAKVLGYDFAVDELDDLDEAPGAFDQRVRKFEEEIVLELKEHEQETIEIGSKIREFYKSASRSLADRVSAMPTLEPEVESSGETPPTYPYLDFRPKLGEIPKLVAWLDDSVAKRRENFLTKVGNEVYVEPASLLSLIMLDEAIRGFETGKFRASDLRYILFFALSRHDVVVDATFVARLARIVDAHPRLRQVLLDEQVYFSGGPYQYSYHVSSVSYASAPPVVAYEKLREAIGRPLDRVAVRKKAQAECRIAFDHFFREKIAKLRNGLESLDGWAWLVLRVYDSLQSTCASFGEPQEFLPSKFDILYEYLKHIGQAAQTGALSSAYFSGYQTKILQKYSNNPEFQDRYIELGLEYPVFFENENTSYFYVSPDLRARIADAQRALECERVF